MSIIIKGMEMPTGCGAWHLTVWPDGQVEIITADGEWKTSEAVSIPPHGRLIDADELKKVIASAKHMDAQIYDGKVRTMYSDHLCVGADYDDVCAAIDETPTVIPANSEEEEMK